MHQVFVSKTNDVCGDCTAYYNPWRTCGFGLAHVRAVASARLLVDTKVPQSGAGLNACQWVRNPVLVNGWRHIAVGPLPGVRGRVAEQAQKHRVGDRVRPVHITMHCMQCHSFVTLIYPYTIWRRFHSEAYDSDLSTDLLATITPKKS